MYKVSNIEKFLLIQAKLCAENFENVFFARKPKFYQKMALSKKRKQTSSKKLTKIKPV